jgi:hypothetical protein
MAGFMSVNECWAFINNNNVKNPVSESIWYLSFERRFDPC